MQSGGKVCGGQPFEQANSEKSGEDLEK